MDTETGECGERRLEHMEGAGQFYRDLQARGITVRIGIEASGYTRWFEQLMAELDFELWIGDAAAISRKRVRKQKTDKQDAELLLKLLIENRFPRIWCPAARTAICGNCSGTATGWCRCKPGCGISCMPWP